MTEHTLNLYISEFKRIYSNFLDPYSLPSFLNEHVVRRLICSLATLASVAQTKLLYLACLALLYLRLFHGLLVCFALAGLRRLHLACSLAKLASLVRTMLGLLDLRRLRLPRSLEMLASLV